MKVFGAEKIQGHMANLLRKFIGTCRGMGAPSQCGAAVAAYSSGKIQLLVRLYLEHLRSRRVDGANEVIRSWKAIRLGRILSTHEDEFAYLGIVRLTACTAARAFY